MSLPAYTGPLGRTWHYVFMGICVLVFIFLIAPILVIIPLSFNAEPYFTFTPEMLRLDPEAFSLRWYLNVLGIGEGTGENRSTEAAERAVSSPLLEMPIDGAKGVIFNVSGGSDITLDEVTTASEVIKAKVHPDANIIFGSVTNPKNDGKVRITVIATGFPEMLDDDFVNRNIKQEGVAFDDLEVPPFLRKHPGALRRLRSGTL